jgi:hypothetical protein
MPRVCSQLVSLCTLEQNLRIYCNHMQSNWSTLLLLDGFAYNNAPRASTAFATRGYDLGMAVYPDAEVADLRAIHYQLRQSTHVLVRANERRPRLRDQGC